MAISFDRFIEIVEQAAPMGCAYPWDNSGATVRLGDTVNRVMLTLDVTEDVIRQAEEQACDMILSHHPLIFREIKKLDHRDPITGLVLRAVCSGISLYAAHTSYDCACGGLNFALAEQLGMKDLQVFLPEEAPGEGTGLGVMGILPEETDRQGLICMVKERIGQQHPRYNDVNGRYDRAAVVSGAGGEFFRQAKQAGIGVLITGEAKYNHFIDAAQMGILLIEAGHFETERMFIEKMAAHLTEYFKNEEIDILCAEAVSPCRIG